MTKSRKDLLAERLEDDIVAGRLVPGERLDEVSLATSFGVSRTPVREVLQKLASSGLVELRPRRGAIVARISIGRLVEMFEVMAELEGMCGRLAARRMTSGEHDALAAALAACRKTAHDGDADAYYYENKRFHHVIYDGSHNGFLAEQARALHRRLQPYRRLQLRVRTRLRTSLAEHERVVAALLAGDADTAEAALKAHVAIQGERFTDLLASLEAATSAAE
jgi:DNA-binding GntR family transcriptional regulator